MHLLWTEKWDKDPVSMISDNKGCTWECMLNAEGLREHSISGLGRHVIMHVRLLGCRPALKLGHAHLHL